jgi:arylsulfatase A
MPTKDRIESEQTSMNSTDYTRRDFLKALGVGAATAAAGCVNASRDLPGRVRKDRPNIIFILADDLGWAELGCCGNAFNETPNLDSLAGRGVRFTQAYASAPVCSPYRAALMTGLYPARIGITDYLRPNDARHLPTDYVTLPENLRRAGYATGIIGKWHLTGYANHGAEEFPPAMHGFDEVIVSENRGIGDGSYFHPYRFNREIQKRLPGKEYLVDRCNLEAVQFIERHKDRPFFLYLSHYAVHTTLQGKEDLVAKYQAKPGAGKGQNARRNNPHLAAQLESIDDGVGMIVDKLAELGLTENSILVFTGDNGGEDRVTSNAPLRAGKSTLYEGGIRVPLIICWPGVTKAGGICDTPTVNTDFYPTFLEAAGLPEPPGPCDGVSITSLLKNTKAKLKRNALYWHYPLAKPHFLGGRSAGAVRYGDFKLIEFFDTGSAELYNLADDISEKNDLARNLPVKLAQLKRLLQSWRAGAGAVVPERES